MIEKKPTKLKLDPDTFNRMVVMVLLKFMEWDNIPAVHREKKLQLFNQWLNEAEQAKLFINENKNQNESVQLSEDDKIKS
jgi:hypothetical protein